MEGLYSGLVTSPFTASPDPGQAPDSPFANRGSQQPVSPDLMEAKLKLLVEAPAAVEDALASLLNHADPGVQVCTTRTAWYLEAHLALHYLTLMCCIAPRLLNLDTFKLCWSPCIPNRRSTQSRQYHRCLQICLLSKTGVLMQLSKCACSCLLENAVASA